MYFFDIVKKDNKLKIAFNPALTKQCLYSIGIVIKTMSPTISTTIIPRLSENITFPFH